MADKKKDRYDEIRERLAALDAECIKNQQAKDKALNDFRAKQAPLNKEIAELNRELVKVIKADPERAAKYQVAGK